jgi:hypothetical protein
MLIEAGCEGAVFKKHSQRARKHRLQMHLKRADSKYTGDMLGDSAASLAENPSKGGRSVAAYMPALSARPNSTAGQSLRVLSRRAQGQGVRP